MKLAEALRRYPNTTIVSNSFPGFAPYWNKGDRRVYKDKEACRDHSGRPERYWQPELAMLESDDWYPVDYDKLVRASEVYNLVRDYAMLSGCVAAAMSKDGTEFVLAGSPNNENYGRGIEAASRLRERLQALAGDRVEVRGFYREWVEGVGASYQVEVDLSR